MKKEYVIKIAKSLARDIEFKCQLKDEYWHDYKTLSPKDPYKEKALVDYVGILREYEEAVLLLHVFIQEYKNIIFDPEEEWCGATQDEWYHLYEKVARSE